MSRSLLVRVSILFLLFFLSGCGPANPSLLRALQPVASGQGVPNAAAYAADSPGPHRLVVLDASGARHEWNKNLPPEWLASSVRNTELVVVVHPEREVRIDSHTYINKAGQEVTIDRTRHEVDVDIREARTGNILWSYTLRGIYPGRIPHELRGNTGLEGEPVRPTAFVAFLRCKIQQDQCRMLEVQDVIDFALSPDGELLALGLRDGSVQLRSVNTGELLRTLEGPQQAVTSIAFSRDNTLLASGYASTDSSDAILQLWRVSNGEVLYSQELYGAYFVHSLSFSPDGLFLAASTPGTYRSAMLWHVTDGETLDPECIDVMGYVIVTYRSDGALLTFESYQRNGSDYSYVALWSVGRNSCTLLQDKEIDDAISSISLSDDGMRLATGNVRGGIVVKRLPGWDNEYSLRDDPPFVFDISPVTSLDFSSDGILLVSALSVYAQIWRLDNTYLIENALETWEFPANVTRASFSPQGQSLIVLLEDGTIWIWEMSGVTTP